MTKNCAVTIAETINSVAAVKSSRVEYIIVDGASTDGTLPLIEAKSEFIDIFLSEPDSGIYSAMNKGVRLSRGKYVLFLNGDDVLILEGFNTAFTALESKNCDIFCAQTKLKTMENGSFFLKPRPKMLPFFNSVPHPSAFVKRQLLLQTPFREDLRIASDYQFFLEALIDNKKFENCDVPTTIHDRGGASSDHDLSSSEVKAVRRELLGYNYYIYENCMVSYRWLKSLFSKGVSKYYG